MSNKEFRVRHGLVVGNNVLVANVTSNTVSVTGTINAAIIQVNGATIPSGTTSNLVFDTVNTAFNVANAAFTSANNVAPQVAPAFNTANAAYTLANVAYNATNSVFGVANAGFNKANSANVLAYNTGIAANNYAGAMANSANAYADGTYVKLTAASQTITGNLSITGNLNLLGGSTIISSNNLSVGDSLIYLAANNYSGTDFLDIGFIANYGNTTGANVHTGLVRDAIDKQYYLFNAYDREPANNTFVPGGNNMVNAVLVADLNTSNLTLGGANAITWIGASYSKANAALANTSGTVFSGVLTLSDPSTTHSDIFANADNTYAVTDLGLISGAYGYTGSYSAGRVHSGTKWISNTVSYVHQANHLTLNSNNNVNFTGQYLVGLSNITEANNFSGINTLKNYYGIDNRFNYTSANGRIARATAIYNNLNYTPNSSLTVSAAYGTFNNIQFTPKANTAGHFITAYPHYNALTVSAAENNVVSFGYRGIDNNLNATSSGNNTYLYAGTLYGITTLLTINGGNGSNSSTVINTIYGNYVKVQIANNSYYGTGASGNVIANNLFSIYVAADPNSGTVTASNTKNTYAIYVENPGKADISSYAIYVAGGNTYFGGNVGVGTTNAQYPLDVAGAANISLPTLLVAGSNVLASFASANAYAAAVGTSANAYSDSLLVTARAYTNTSTTAANTYAGTVGTSTNNYTSATYSTLTQFGSVFGVANAAFGKANTALQNTTGTFSGTLTLTGTATIGGGNATIQGSVNPWIGLIDGTNGTSYLQVASGITNLYAGGTQPISFSTSGSTRAYIDASGNLGIGTTSPIAQLHINGTTNLGQRILSLAPYGAGGGGASVIVMGNSDSGGTSGPSVIQSYNRLITFGVGNSHTAAGGGTFTEFMRIDPNGNVGIGTTSPSSYSMLSVIGGAITSGTVTSTTGSVLLRGYYSSGAISVWGTEYSSGGPVMGYGVKPSTSAAASFISSSAAALSRGAYTIAGNEHVWYSGGNQTVAEDSAVTVSEKMRLDSAGVLKFNSGYGSVATAYGCRAWGKYNGVTPALNGSGNISSTSRTATGYYTISFSSAMPDTNYSISAAAGDAAVDRAGVSPDTYATGSFRLMTWNVGNGTINMDYTSFSVHR